MSDSLFPTLDLWKEDQVWSITEYCAEEVSRQGHDITKPDGLRRIAGMLHAWCVALDQPLVLPPDIGVLEHLGSLIERNKNRRGLRKCRVRVSGSSDKFPEPDEVPALLRQLLLRWFDPALTHLEFYRAFLKIHPFADGNGRVGKVLLNWRAGTLQTPFFPPNDFWGEPIRNP